MYLYISHQLSYSAFWEIKGLPSNSSFHYFALRNDRHNILDDFFKTMHTSLEAEMARYDAVLHLSPPTNPAFYQSTHVRTESLAEAFKIDEKILKIWEGHPNRLIVEGKEHFFEKAEIIKNFVEKIIRG